MINRIKNSIQELESIPAAAAAAGGDSLSNDRVWSDQNQAGDMKAIGKCQELKYADALAESLSPIQTVGPDWYEYDTGVWKQLDKAAYLPQAQKILPEKLRKAKDAKALLEHLEGRFQVPPDKLKGFHYFDTDEAILINVANGVVKVTKDTIDLQEHSPDHQFCRKMAAEYHPEAVAETFQRVLKEALPDEEDRRLFQILTGNVLLPDCRHEVAVVCYGEGGTGKSSVLHPIVAAFGEELVRPLGLNQICDHRSYDLPRLRFAALNLAYELDALPLDDSANFKAIVSGEPLEARPIYGKPFTMKSTVKLWFLANGLPRFKNGTDAEVRRIRFLRFASKPATKDVNLKQKLVAERDGALNFMLAGLQTLLTMPEIMFGSASSQHVQDRFRVSNDPLGTFVADCCVLNQEESDKKQTIRNAFEDFTQAHGLDLDADHWFFRKLYERFPQLGESHRRCGGSRVRYIQGLKVKEKP